MGEDDDSGQPEIVALEIEQDADSEGLECKLMGLLGAAGPKVSLLNTLKLEGNLKGSQFLSWWIVEQHIILLLLK